MTDSHYRIPKILNDEDDDHPSNPCAGPALSEIIVRRLSRRAALMGFAATSGLAVLAGGPGASARKALAAPAFGFAEIPHGYDENLHVPSGYKAETLMRWGDPVLPGATQFDPSAIDAASQAGQFGYNCDFVHFAPLPEGSTASDHGLLVVNHEYTDAHMMFSGFADGEAALAAATAESVEIEQAAHGLSVVEIMRADGKWRLVDGTLNRRITVATPIAIAGPAAGHDRLKTKNDPTGKLALGTINNCGGGWTPWGTVLSAEENFHGYFGGDPAGSAETENHKRYGIKGEPSYAWGKFDARFDVGGAPNEPNRFGWVVEIDPYDSQSRPVKRTALGRFKHEAATCVVNKDGRIVVYTGDDERFEYVYRFVSDAAYDPAKGRENSALLDQGTLFVARFDETGSVEWMPLVFGQGKLTQDNGFSSQADVLIEARRAADLLGATKMDRPEDIETSQATGKVYVVLTKNDKRKADQADAANARPGNKWGHIVELTPPGEAGGLDHAAARFEWSAFILAGDPKTAEHGARYGAGVSNAGWFANPDNIAFDPRGRLWIATDGFPDHGVHDGLWVAETEGHARARSLHFLGCPSGAEMCGPAFTPDGTTLFVAVQHPGADDGSNFAQPSTRWPDFKDGVPPRPSIVAITRDGGGEVGS
jgi:uncharacterized protein